jgi:hypothetical protein
VKFPAVAMSVVHSERVFPPCVYRCIDWYVKIGLEEAALKRNSSGYADGGVEGSDVSGGKDGLASLGESEEQVDRCTPYNQLGFRLDLYLLSRQQIHAKPIPEFNRNIP